MPFQLLANPTEMPVIGIINECIMAIIAYMRRTPNNDEKYIKILDRLNLYNPD